MPKYIPSIPIEDCYGSVGELTFYHKGGECFYKRRSRPSFPGTSAQLEQLGVHQRAIAAWQGLEHAVQLEWNRIAPAVIVHRPPFDRSTHMSGYNLFVSAYHGFAALGDEHTPLPVAWREFPIYAVDGISQVSVDGGTLRLGFHVFMEADSPSSRYRLLVRLHLASPGSGRDRGKMRNFLSYGYVCGGDTVVTVEVPDYVNIWGLDLSSYQVHLRHVLLDSQTGYRNIWAPASFLVNLP